MKKNIPQVLLDRIQSDDVESFMLLRIGPNGQGQEMRHTTLPWSYTDPSDGRTYPSDSRIVSIDPPRVSDSLDRGAFQIGLVDSDGSLRSVLDTWGMYGCPLVIKVGWMNNTGDIIDGVDSGQPFNEKLIAYSGTVDTFTYSITPDQDVVLAIEGTSPMGALDLTRIILTSKTYLRGKYPNDSSYDQVLEGSGKILLKWGR